MKKWIFLLAAAVLLCGIGSAAAEGSPTVEIKRNGEWKPLDCYVIYYHRGIIYGDGTRMLHPFGPLEESQWYFQSDYPVPAVVLDDDFSYRVTIDEEVSHFSYNRVFLKQVNIEAPEAFLNEYLEDESFQYRIDTYTPVLMPIDGRINVLIPVEESKENRVGPEELEPGKYLMVLSLSTEYAQDEYEVAECYLWLFVE